MVTTIRTATALKKKTRKQESPRQQILITDACDVMERWYLDDVTKYKGILTVLNNIKGKTVMSQ